MAFSVEDGAFLLASFGLEALFCAKLCYPCGSPHLREVIQGMLKSLRQVGFWPAHLVSLLRRSFTKKKSIIDDEVAAMQMAWSARFLYAYGFLSLSSLASIQYNVLLGRQRWMSLTFTWTNVVVYGCLTLYMICPQLLSISSLNKFYAVGMVLAGSYLSPWHTPPEMMMNMALILFVFFRFPAVIMCTRVSVVLLCNLAFAVWTIYRAVNEDMVADGSFGSAYVIFWVECLVCVITVAFSVALRCFLARKAEHKIQQANAESQLGAASTLLGLMCDAVVELDERFELLEHSKALAAMLLKSSNLAGVSLLDFMPALDAERAKEHLKIFGGTASAGWAHAFHTHLVDSCSSKLSTEVFQVKYTKLDGSQCHLVGLREFSDRYQQASPFEVAESLPADPDEDDVPEEREDYQRITLNIDMKEMKICAASRPVEGCVGMAVADVFPAMHTIQLLRKLQAQAEAQGLPSSVYSFNEMPVCWEKEMENISGTMQMTNTAFGPRILVTLKMDENGTAASTTT